LFYRAFEAPSHKLARYIANAVGPKKKASPVGQPSA